MNPNFTTQTNYTYDEYLKFNELVPVYYLTAKRKMERIKHLIKWAWILDIVFIAECVMFNLLSEDRKFYTVLTIFSVIITTVVIFVSLIVLAFYHAMKQMPKIVKREYDANLFIQREHFLSFCDDYVEEKTEYSQIKLKYSMIHKVLETETNFYIMFSEIQGLIVVKENCSPQLIDFLTDLKNNNLSKQ